MENKLVIMLQEFISSFEASLDPELWLSLVEEEAEEVKEALRKEDREAILKEATDLMYVSIGFNLVVSASEQFGLLGENRQKKMMDRIKSSAATYDSAVDTLGTDLNYFEAFRRVHLSNMSKMGEDGKPIRRYDGKILKGPNYIKPSLGDLV
jgi:predicted HAD superfamily Cof-like phosphohydrolase